MMALQTLEIEIVGTTTVRDNTSARIADVNTLGISNIIAKQSEIPVMQGAEPGHCLRKFFVHKMCMVSKDLEMSILNTAKHY